MIGLTRTRLRGVTRWEQIRICQVGNLILQDYVGMYVVIIVTKYGVSFTIFHNKRKLIPQALTCQYVYRFILSDYETEPDSLIKRKNAYNRY